jgi:hypothetical protein
MAAVRNLTSPFYGTLASFLAVCHVLICRSSEIELSLEALAVGKTHLAPALLDVYILFTLRRLANSALTQTLTL